MFKLNFGLLTAKMEVEGDWKCKGKTIRTQDKFRKEQVLRGSLFVALLGDRGLNTHSVELWQICLVLLSCQYSFFLALSAFGHWGVPAPPTFCPHATFLLLLLCKKWYSQPSLVSWPAVGYFCHHHSTIHTHLWFSHYFGPWWCLCGCIAIFLYLGIFTYFSCCLSRLGSLKTNWLCSVCGGMNL